MHSESNKTHTIVFLSITLITVLALVLRFSYFITRLDAINISGDALNYHIMANQLVQHHTFGYALKKMSGTPNALVTPTYPFFLGLIDLFVKNDGAQINTARFFQVILSGFTPLIAFLFVKEFFKSKKAALIAAFLTAVYPPFVESPDRILTEVIALFTMVLFFYLMTLGFKKKTPWINICAGLVFGIHVLARPPMLPMIIFPFIFGFFTVFKNDIRQLIKVFIYTMIGIVVIMLPWWIRNVLVLHQLVLTATGSGNPLLAGSYPDMKDLFKDFNLGGYSYNDQSWFAMKRIKYGFTHHFFEYLRWYTIGKINFMFGTPWLIEEMPQIEKLNKFIHFFSAWIGLLGLIWGIFKNSKTRLLTAYTTVFLGLYLIFIPTTRYAFQFMFLLIVSASYLLAFLIDKAVLIIKGQKQQQITE